MVVVHGAKRANAHNCTLGCSDIRAAVFPREKVQPLSRLCRNMQNLHPLMEVFNIYLNKTVSVSSDAGDYPALGRQWD